jgi:beta-N-acetylhexosaminidase
VKVVMSAHIALPGVDPGELRPGTVAPNVLTGILRDSLAFEGMVVTDALDMAGVAKVYGADAAVRAFLAGADLLLQPTDPAAAIAAVEAAVARGEISPERLERSVRRVLEAKRDLGLFTRRTVPLDSVPAVVGSGRFMGEARDVAARSIVMVKDVNGTVHSLRSAKPAITLVTFGEEENRSVGLALAAELRRQGQSAATFRLWPGSGAASYDSAVAAIARRPVALFVTADKPTAWRGALGLPERLAALISASARTRPTILVSLGNPYLISRLPEVGSYLIGWRSNTVTEEAVARALAGAAPITGRLPISIPPLYPRGWGVERRVSP